MLEDFQQDKNEQPLDPLSEGPSLTIGKKVGLACATVALVGLFIFFTGDSWSSNHKEAPTQDALSLELDALKARVAELEQKVLAQNLVQPLAQEQPLEAIPTERRAITPEVRLQSILEQELQETPAADETEFAQRAEPEPATVLPKRQQPVAPTSKQQIYVVKKGDSLSKISQKFYGTPNKWKKIVEANRDKLGHKNILKVGMTLVIPKEPRE